MNKVARLARMTNRLASVLSKSLATREDLFPRSPFRASVRIADYRGLDTIFVNTSPFGTYLRQPNLVLRRCIT